MSFKENISDAVVKKLLDPVLRANYLSAGEMFWVFEDSDTGFQKMTQDHPKNTFVTVQEAYDACTTNRNDVINVNSHSAHAITTGIAWSKSRIHVIGLDGGDRLIQQGSRFVGATADDTGYVVKITGTRNSFRNIKFEQRSTDAAGLTVVQFGGEGTLVKNCSFVFGVATRLGGTTTHEVVMGEDSGTFINCTFGNDTLETSGARAVMLIDIVTASQEMKSNIFKDCVFSINSSEATAHFIRVKANTDLKFSNTFINPVFVCAITASMSTAVLSEAVENEVQAGEGNLLFIWPASNTTNFSTATNANTNIQVISPVTSANDTEAKTPVA